MSRRLSRAELEAAVQHARREGFDRDPPQLLRWAYDLLGDRLMMSTAFGKSGMVLLHMIKDSIPKLPIYFVDTRFHFPETMAFIDQLERAWEIRIRIQAPEMSFDTFRREHGAQLYDTNPDLCCHINKVEPFAALLDRYNGWIAGIRRDQSATRAEAEPIEILETNQLKVQPLVSWTRATVEEYLAQHDVPLHPLFKEGYTSIGCAPCTRPNLNGSDERAGRWAGKAKTECGLHLFRRKIKPATGPSGSDGGAPAPPAAPSPAAAASPPQEGDAAAAAPPPETPPPARGSHSGGAHDPGRGSPAPPALPTGVAGSER